MDKTKNKMGILIIIKDNSREVLVCLSSSLQFQSSPIAVECNTLLRALLLCTELDLQQVTFEGDALVVI